MMNDTRYSVLTKPLLTKALLALMALSLAACVGSRERSRLPAEPHLDQVLPPRVGAGLTFQVQPDGRSALIVRGTNLSPKSRIRLNGHVLDTSGGDGTQLSAYVPAELIKEPGQFPVSVETPEGQLSNSLPFWVLSNTGPAPEIGKLYPAEYAAGPAFNKQPNGASALGITGQNFLPDPVVEINGEPTVTAFGGSEQLSALVPDKFIQKPGRLKITVRNRDGKVSAAAELILK
jgi:hypothetical protein